MNRISRLIAVAALAIAASGCAGLGYNGMKADEINAATKDRSSAFVCTEVFGPWGKGTSFVVNADHTQGTAGGEMTGKCGGSEFSYKDAGKAAPVPRVPIPVVDVPPK